GPGTVVLTQGARGTDLLVTEEARLRGAEVRVFLALPITEFLARSVTLPRSRWGERFQDVLAACEVIVQAAAIGPLPAGEDPFDRNNRWVLDQALAMAGAVAVPIRAVVVWDGEDGDGHGGAAAFVQAAYDRGIAPTVVNPRRTWREP